MVTNAAVKSFDEHGVDLHVVGNAPDNFAKTIEELGGTFPLKFLCEKYDLDENEVQNEIDEGKLLSLGVDMIPAFQYVNFKKVEHLEEVLELFPDKVPAQEIIEFMAQPFKVLKNKSMIYVLRKGVTEKVLTTIKNEIKHAYK